MSHLEERKDKNCLNCNARVYGRYCHVCGQENLEPGESLWHLITHFFNDITHFDGKFFSTLKLLVIKPGFLPGEYKRGRRTSYLNPVRMYIFTSFTFFLIFFSVYDFDPENFNTKFNGLGVEEVKKLDSAEFSEFTADLNNGRPLTREEFEIYKDTTGNKLFVGDSTSSIMGDNYRDRKEYDSLKKAGVVKPSWFQDRLNYQNIKIKEKYNNDNSKAVAATFSIFLHNFPQILFVSLPLFAFFLWLIYIRKKDAYFVAHSIYAVHLYIFYFICLLAIMGLFWLYNKINQSWPYYIIWILVIGLFFYEYKAMRQFYQQQRTKTIFKFILILSLRFLIFIFLFMAFLILSFLKI